MQAPIFYAPPELIKAGVVRLPDDEARHAIAVLRLKKSDQVIVIDGLGTAYRGMVARVSRPKAVEVTVHAEIRNFGEPSVILTLAAGLSSGYKFDNVVARGTELGVKRFVPVFTSKSKVRLDDARRARARVARLEKVALAAAKQCRRAYRPEISVPVNFAEYLRETDGESFNLIFHPTAKVRPLAVALDDARPKRVSLLVGPESGFTDEEVEAAAAAGFVPVSLGGRVLRTETAGPAVVTLIMHLLDELR
ncbi:MAG: 16S rRNA (uracil(1498)-N(3))-methyltransferase [candidate division Zixibacteria bacterium]|nr:16S rRNA (uracil(1498)-N(3))-methyltransferase [candidate division Zixibacteria bacterium]